MADKVKKSDLPLRPYPRVSKAFLKPTRTRASEMPSTDLAMLVQRYNAAGGLPPSTLRFGDVSGLPKSRLEAMEIIKRGADSFAELPLKVRQACGHDPRNLEQWIQSNPQLAEEAGLLLKKSLVSPPENPPSSGDPGEGNEGEAA